MNVCISTWVYILSIRCFIEIHSSVGVQDRLVYFSITILAHFYLVQYTDYYTYILPHLLLINTLVSATVLFYNQLFIPHSNAWQAKEFQPMMFNIGDFFSMFCLLDPDLHHSCGSGSKRTHAVFCEPLLIRIHITVILFALKIYICLTMVYGTHRRRIYTEEKAKVVAAAWGDRIDSRNYSSSMM